MKIINDASLKPFNTFGMDVSTPALLMVESEEEVREALTYCKKNFSHPPFILGGGSNILFTNNLHQPVINISLKGIDLKNEDDDHFRLHAGAGENWHQFVMHCVRQGYAGVENLALIPGNVGASPMQNIGAYGAEVSDVLEFVHTIHIQTGETFVFSKDECKLGYRESIFKSTHKDQFIITGVDYRLYKTPKFNTSYGAISTQLEAMGVEQLTLQHVADAVIHIRKTKLPDPAVLGNAGSFFKNPTVGEEQHRELKERFPKMVSYPVDGGFKIAAGWLIEQCGWKGFRRGDAGCHAMQALVLVNFGNATGREILNLSKEIQQSVEEKFSLHLEREVNVAGSI